MHRGGDNTDVCVRALWVNNRVLGPPVVYRRVYLQVSELGDRKSPSSNLLRNSALGVSVVLDAVIERA